MKRLISLLVALAMLTGMCITAGAQLPGTTSYFEDFEDGNLSSPFTCIYGESLGYSSVLEGVGDETAKIGNKVYKLSHAYQYTSKRTTLEMAVKSANTHNTYENGEKVHMTSQIMIPAGTKFYRDPSGSPSVMLTVLDEAGTAYELGVQNAGDAGYTDQRQVNSVVTFSDNGKIMLFGSQIRTTTTWAYDTWYTVDVVLVMGSKPQVAIYVNGEPLRIDPQFNDDLTFDGVNTSTDYISVGLRSTSTTDSNFTEGAIKGIGDYWPVRASTLNTATEETAVYVDNIGYQALAANQEADIYTPFALAGVKDGDVVDRADLAAATVTVPKWDAADIAKVSITVDGAETALAEDAEAPYVFDLSKLERGIRTLTINAYNTADELVKTRDYSISVAGNETQVRTDCDFEGTKTTIYGDGLFAEVNGVESAVVTDSDGVSYGQSLKATSNGTNITLKYNQNKRNPYNSGMAYVEYDMYIDNDNIAKFSIESISNYIINYDANTDKFVGKLYGYLASATDYSFSVDFGKWQRWTWMFDYNTSKITLWIDGTPVINGAGMNNATTNLVEGLAFVFGSEAETTNYFALDNFKVWRENALTVNVANMNGATSSIPSNLTTSVITGEAKVGVVYDADGETPLNSDFGNSLLMEFDAEDAGGSGKYIQVNQKFTLPTGITHTPANGITTIEYDIYLANSDYHALNFEVNNEYLWQSKNMYVNATEAPKFDLTPGAWHHHKFVLTPPAAAGGKPFVAVYADGKHVRTTPANTNFAQTGYIAFAFTAAADADNGNKAKPNLMALDNLSLSYEPIVPYMKGVAFDAASAYGEVLDTATSATITMGGVPTLVEDKISVVKADGTALEGASASVSGNTITVSGLALTAGETYRIEIAEGLGFDNNSKMATTEKISYTFKAVEALAEAIAATDGVQAVKFFVHNSAGDSAYVPGTGFNTWDHICAEARVNNLSGEEKSFNLILATYDAEGRLQKVSVGDCSVLANSVGRTVSSGYIVFAGANEDAGTPADDLNVTMKAFVLDSLGNLAPLGPVVFSDPQA